MNSLIINKPKFKSNLRTFIEGIFSLVWWAIFVYYFQPLIATAVWLVTGHWLMPELYPDTMAEPIIGMVIKCFGFSTLIAFIMFGWSRWNLWCYGGLDRRKPRPPVEDDTIAAILHVSRETLYAAQKGQIALVTPAGEGVTFDVIKEVKSPVYIEEGTKDVQNLRSRYRHKAWEESLSILEPIVYNTAIRKVNENNQLKLLLYKQNLEFARIRALIRGSQAS